MKTACLQEYILMQIWLCTQFSFSNIRQACSEQRRKKTITSQKVFIFRYLHSLIRCSPDYRMIDFLILVLQFKTGRIWSGHKCLLFFINFDLWCFHTNDDEAFLENLLVNWNMNDLWTWTRHDTSCIVYCVWLWLYSDCISVELHSQLVQSLLFSE